MNRETYAGTAMELLRFSIPMILGAVFQQMFSWADALIVGNFAGEQALAAIGTTNSCYNLLLDLILGASAGLTVLAARYYGAGNRERLHRLSVTYVRLAGACSVLLAVTGILFAGKLMTLLETPAEILSDTVLYLRWLYGGLVFLGLYNILAALLRAMGNSRAPFRAVIWAGLANIVLDCMFVAGLRMGVGGAAAATFLTQGVMTLYLLAYVLRHEPFLLKGLRQEGTDWELFREGMFYALPLMLQGGAASAGKVILTGFRNGFGVSVIAAISTAYRVDTILISPVRSLGAAIAAKVSQKLGAAEPEKARGMFRAGLVMSVCFAAVMTVFVRVFGNPLIGIFGVSAPVREMGAAFFRHLGQFYAVCALMEAFHGFLQGCGDVRFTAGNMMFQLGLRIMLSYLLKAPLGWTVIAYAEGLSWCAAAGTGMLRCRIKLREITE